MAPLRAWLIGLLLTVLLVTAAFLWVDRAISLFAHHEFAQLPIFRELTRIPEIMEIVASLVFAAVGLHALFERKLTKLASALLLSGISIVVAAQLKNDLKFVFGRTWPETWINNNPSLIRDDVYGFNFFHGGAGYMSFPSGHTTVTCAVMAVFWICYPRYRPLYAAIVAAVAIGLMGANYHFLSDIIAGGFLGASTGWITVLLWEAGGGPRLSTRANPAGS